MTTPYDDALRRSHTTIRRIAKAIRRTTDYAAKVADGHVAPPPHITVAWAKACGVPLAALIPPPKPTSHRPLPTETPTPLANALSNALAGIREAHQRASGQPSNKRAFSLHTLGLSHAAVQRLEGGSMLPSKATIEKYSALQPHPRQHLAALLPNTPPINKTTHKAIALDHLTRGTPHTLTQKQLNRAYQSLYRAGRISATGVRAYCLHQDAPLMPAHPHPIRPHRKVLAALLVQARRRIRLSSQAALAEALSGTTATEVSDAESGLALPTPAHARYLSIPSRAIASATAPLAHTPYMRMVAALKHHAPNPITRPALRAETMVTPKQCDDALEQLISAKCVTRTPNGRIYWCGSAT